MVPLQSGISPFAVLFFLWLFVLPPLWLGVLGTVTIKLYRRAFGLETPSPPVVLLGRTGDRWEPGTLRTGVVALVGSVAYLVVLNAVNEGLFLAQFTEWQLSLRPVVLLVGLLVPLSLPFLLARWGSYTRRETGAYALFFLAGAILLTFHGRGVLGFNYFLPSPGPVNVLADAPMQILVPAVLTMLGTARLLSTRTWALQRANHIAAAGTLLVIGGVATRLLVPGQLAVVWLGVLGYVAGLLVTPTALVFALTD